MESVVIKIHEDNLSIFNEKLKELNKKFAKKELPLISCSMTSEIIEEKLSDAEISFAFNGQYHPWAEYRRYTLYTATLSSDFNQTNLSGVDVEFEGVVSLIEKEESSKVYTFKNINYSSLLANCSCDKCHKKIGRNKYLVFSKVGKEVETRDDLVVLGTSCAKDYFPFSVESYFGYLESAFEELGSYDEFSGSFGGCASHYKSLRSIFNATLAVTNNLKIYEKEGVTKSNVFGWMNNDRMGKYDRYRDVYPMPENPIAFEDVISWVKDMLDKSTEELRSDFEINARSVFFKTLDDGTREMRHEIHEKYVGIAVYAFFSAKQNHDKMIAKKVAEEERAKENAKVEYYGAVGDKFELTLTYDKTFAFQGDWGTTFIHLYHDDDGHKFKWSSSCGNCGKNFNWKEYEVGHKYLIKGTVKSHVEYKGCKQTVITRCKVLDDFNTKEVENTETEKVTQWVDPFETMMNIFESSEISA